MLHEYSATDPSPQFCFYFLFWDRAGSLWVCRDDLKLVIFLSQPSHSPDSQVCPRSVILLSFIGPNSMDDQLVFAEFNFCETIAISPAFHDAPVPNVWCTMGLWKSKLWVPKTGAYDLKRWYDILREISVSLPGGDAIFPQPGPRASGWTLCSCLLSLCSRPTVQLSFMDAMVSIRLRVCRLWLPRSHTLRWLLPSRWSTHGDSG